MGLTEAKAAGAVAMFGEKYDNEVRVVDVPGVSMELCGGTHVANTVELGGFKVLSETGIASGIRRIEAVAGPALMPHVNSVDAVVRDLSVRLKIGADSIPARVESMQKELMAKEKQIVALQSEVAVAKASALAAQVQTLAPRSTPCYHFWHRAPPQCSAAGSCCIAMGVLYLAATPCRAVACCYRSRLRIVNIRAPAEPSHLSGLRVLNACPAGGAYTMWTRITARRE